MPVKRLFLLAYTLRHAATFPLDICQDNGDHACMSNGSSLLTLSNGLRIEHQQGMSAGYRAGRINDNDNDAEYERHKSSASSTKFALLLTTFNEPERTEMYA